MAHAMSNDHTRANLDDLQRRVQGMLVRGTVGSVDDALMMQLLDIKLEHGHRPTRVENWHPYGFSAHPKSDAEVLAASLGGNRDHMVVLGVADRRYRIKSMEGGEIAVHDDQGQKVHFKRASLWIETDKKVVVKTSTMRVGDDTDLPRVMTEAGPSSVLRAKV